MKLLLNSTKTMDLSASIPAGIRTTPARFMAQAAQLTEGLRALSRRDFGREMALGENLARATRADLARWGEKKQPARPALFAFTGLVYKYVDPTTLPLTALQDAQKRLLILSGLYGLLRPLDRIQAYRLEMGSRWAPGDVKNLTTFWRPVLTEAVNKALKRNEPLLNLAAQEYTKTLDAAALKGPLISPVFKERRPDGSLKTAPVHAKMARGAMVRFALTVGADRPADLLAFGELGWEAADEPPAAGSWLFTRPARD